MHPIVKYFCWVKFNTIQQRFEIKVLWLIKCLLDAFMDLPTSTVPIKGTNPHSNLRVDIFFNVIGISYLASCHSYGAWDASGAEAGRYEWKSILTAHYSTAALLQYKSVPLPDTPLFAKLFVILISILSSKHKGVFWILFDFQEQT